MDGFSVGSEFRFLGRDFLFISVRVCRKGGGVDCDALATDTQSHYPNYLLMFFLPSEGIVRMLLFKTLTEKANGNQDHKIFIYYSMFLYHLLSVESRLNFFVKSNHWKDISNNRENSCCQLSNNAKKVIQLFHQIEFSLMQIASTSRTSAIPSVISSELLNNT